jgi:FlaA1/EpsC-like NDP-sugar epimerase
MGQPLRIVDLATDLVRLSGLDPDDIPIVFSGVRPGEKLEEALWESGAVVEETPNAEILWVNEPDTRQVDLAHVLTMMRVAAERGDRAALDAVSVQLTASRMPPAAPGVVH